MQNYWLSVVAERKSNKSRRGEIVTSATLSKCKSALSPGMPMPILGILYPLIFIYELPLNQTLLDCWILWERQFLQHDRTVKTHKRAAVM
jgi:hypothetical protein